MSRERWQEFDEKATAGPWKFDSDEGQVWDRSDREMVANVGTAWYPQDSEFIAAARTAWPAAERECDQLRAERDQALTLLREIRRLSEPQPNDSMNAHFSPIAKMIDASGLLDDEGQQP